jgi:pimeloyl-ACP methyl ester carboxylesterase
MPTATINNARLWYDQLGWGEPLLLHHGYTASRVNWLPVALQLKQHYQVILMECRGTGESEDTADGYNLEQYALDVLGLMDHLKINKFSYAGHSMGGGIGFVLGAHHLDRLNRLILMAPIPSKGTGMMNASMLETRLKHRRENDRAAIKQNYLDTRFRPEVETDAWIESRVDHIMRVSEGHLTDGAKAMTDIDLAEKLPEITIPTLMIAGSVDGLLSANLADFKRLPNAALQVFSRAGHEVAIHEPEGVSNAIHTFMQHGALSAKDLYKRRT